ncbi:MFS transporter [Actinomycetospora corticicola]|uniref:Putative proline/betaine transporter n=1 Tax=Actinomycetospora corticicola TaxID=663602 RepID=A0A7Y9DSY4_9PSEU|nr:MFS transporter [Actinomycetospora corticicola]NYD34814.1 metabolite-proton symporter [Actinomycetospora corticicola]
MSSVSESGNPGTPPTERRSVVRIVAASMLGTTVEWYDFFLYGVAAAVVFPAVFFPAADPVAGTLLSFGTFAIGFIARPLGGLVFGHYGDKIGRKKLLVLSLLMMGISTFLIGVLPSYATAGVLAPTLLILLRLIQGFALGGEWGGAVLIVSEHGDARNRGFWASWPQAGAPAGQLLANGLLAALAVFQSEEAFLAWGWRIPFLLSAVLVLIGLYVRLSVEESPIFQAARAKAEAAAEGAPPAPPILEVIRRYPREVLVAMGARFAENVSYYLFTIVISTYMKQQYGLPSSFVLNAVLIGAAVHIVTIPLWGAVSDRIGRRPTYVIGAVGVGVWGFAFFGLLDTQSFGLTALAVVIGLVFHGAMYGPQAAFLSELFGTRVRYSGVSIGYQLASVAAGGLAPIIAVALLGATGSGQSIAAYLAVCSVITLVAVFSYSETRDRDLGADDGVVTGASGATGDGSEPTRPAVGT